MRPLPPPHHRGTPRTLEAAPTSTCTRPIPAMMAMTPIAHDGMKLNIEPSLRKVLVKVANISGRTGRGWETNGRQTEGKTRNSAHRPFALPLQATSRPSSRRPSWRTRPRPRAVPHTPTAPALLIAHRLPPALAALAAKRLILRPLHRAEIPR